MASKPKRKRATTEAHDEKRVDIIMHCADLFDRVGYHKATMQTLADEVGLGKPTLYHYFRSKADILYAIQEVHMDALLEGLTALHAPKASAADRLRRASVDALKQIADHPGYVRAFMDHYVDLEGEQRRQIRQRRNQYFNSICEVIEQGVASGEFAPCDVQFTAYAFLGICNWAYKWYPPMREKTPPEEAAGLLCDAFLNGLTRKPKVPKR